MKIKTWMKIPFVLNYFFTVMDRYIVYNIPNVHFYIILPELVYKIGYDILLPSYFIQVKKLSYVVLSSVNKWTSAFVIYDGPGFLANSIIVNNTINKIISTSTFQCIIQLMLPTIITYYHNVHTFKYTSSHLVNNNTILVDVNHHNYKVLQLPNTICLDYVCVFLVNTRTDLQINVTLNEIVSEGICNPTCKYGGIVVGEYLDNEFQEYPAVCQKHNGHIEQSRSMYSKNSSLVLVLYWYSMYQNITASVSL